MAFVKYEKDGQGFFDFTDLLERTCEDFVKEIQFNIEFLNDNNETFEVIVDLEFIPMVYIKRKQALDIYKFYTKTNIQYITLSKLDLKSIVDIFGELNG